MDRKYQVAQRRFDMQCRAEADGGMYVEGYAVVFDSPTVLFEMNGMEYREQICRGALDNTDMSDVIFNYNHGGKVTARTRNNTLWLKVDDYGLFVRARLDGTEEGRRLYEEIKGGYIDRMSFRFKIGEEGFDRDARQWNVRSIKKLYDVSAVDIPAYDDTSIEARRAEIEKYASEIQLSRREASPCDEQPNKVLRERVLIRTKV